MLKIKKIILFFIFLSYNSAFTQSFEFGLNFGFNNSKQSLRTDDVGLYSRQPQGIIQNTIQGIPFKVKNLQGYNFGIYTLLNFKIKDDAFAWRNDGSTIYLGIQPESQFSLHGTKIMDSNNSTWNNKLYYLSIPILLNIKIGKVSILFGPQMSFIQDKKSSYDRSKGLGDLSLKNLANLAAFNTLGSVAEFDMSQYSDKDIMFVTGFEIDLPYNFKFSIRNLSGTDNISKIENQTWKNNSWQFSIKFTILKSSKNEKISEN